MSALDNPMWHTLSGPHARHAVGTDRARRYAPGFSAIVGFADVARPAFDDLAPFCAPGEPLYVDTWSGPVPRGWRLVADSTMLRMVWSATRPADAPAADIVALGAGDAAQALALATLTQPGPFGPRTIELGDYVGCRDAGGRLIAMAGERMFPTPWREISGVCTHPDHQGRGLARRLMLALLRRELDRGETPFLHVRSGNATAVGLYRRMGFDVHAEVALRVVARDG